MSLTTREERLLDRLVSERGLRRFVARWIIPPLIIVLMIGWAWRGIATTIRANRLGEMIRRSGGETELYKITDRGLTAEEWRYARLTYDGSSDLLFAGILLLAFLIAWRMYRLERLIVKLATEPRPDDGAPES